MRSRLFAEAKLTYKRAVELALTLEAVERHAQASGSGCGASAATAGHGAAELHRVETRSARATGGGGGGGGCWQCGRPHRADGCRFKNYSCVSCGQKGHLKSMCKKGPQGASEKLPGRGHNYIDGDDDSEYDFYNLNVCGKDGEPYMIKMLVNGVKFTFELDTGMHGERELLVPAHLNFGKYMLDRLRKAELERTCWHNCTTGEKLSYREFMQHAVRLAAALAQRGVGRGDTVLVGGERRVAALPTRLAVILTGAACTNTELQCGRAVLAHKLNLTKPKYIICTRLFWEAYSDLLKGLDFVDTFISFEAIEEMELNVEAMVSRPVDVATFEPAAVSGACDVALVAYSSGTTSMSKGVLLTHLNCIVECNMNTQWYNDYDSYQFAQTLQTTFFAFDSDHTSTYDFFMICASICAGTTAIYSENEVEHWKNIQDFQVDTMPTVPAVLDMMFNIDKDVYDLSSLRLVYVAGSTLHPRTKKAFKERCPGVKLLNLYGASEVGFITTIPMIDIKGADEIPNSETSSVGHAAPDVTIKVVDLKTRAALGPNERGEICVQSPRLMKGYLGSTAPCLDEQGFYLTGDLGYYDDHKRFYLVGRLKDIIIHFGYKVSPGDVEAVLLQHSAVSAAAVVGAPAGAAGEHAVGFVVLRPGATATAGELQDYVAQRVTWYMRLHGGVRFLPELPRSPNRKVLRRRLREMLELEENV